MYMKKLHFKINKIKNQLFKTVFCFKLLVLENKNSLSETIYFFLSKLEFLINNAFEVKEAIFI
jgi:hypothetical protein